MASNTERDRELAEGIVPLGEFLKSRRKSMVSLWADTGDRKEFLYYDRRASNISS